MGGPVDPLSKMSYVTVRPSLTNETVWEAAGEEVGSSIRPRRVRERRRRVMRVHLVGDHSDRVWPPSMMYVLPVAKLA